MARWQALQAYVLTRLLLAPLMLWTVVTVVFLLLRATPGDPVDAMFGGRVPEAVRAELRTQLGLNRPLFLQYLAYLGNLLRFDLGDSLTDQGQTVVQIIGEHLPATVELALASFGVAAGLGIAVGILTGAKPGTGLDLAGRLFSIVTYALPLFWVGMLAQLLFAVNLGWLPLGTRYPVQGLPPAGPTGLYVLDSVLAGNLDQLVTSVSHLLLPSLTLGLVLSGIFERIVRVNLRQALRADYVEAARARGILERWILLNHALRNALIPVITILGLTLASLLGGAVLTEVTFSWPGLANRLYEAISLRDYPTVQGIVVFFGLVVVVLSLAIDVLTALVDPRVRY